METEREHAVSSLALSVPVGSPIFRAERSTFPAAQPPLLFFAPSTQQMHSALSWAASNLSLHLLLLFLSAADSAWCAGGIVLFLEQSSHRHTGVTVLLKNSSGRRYSRLLPLFLSCKLQMTSPFKAGSFLKNKINIAGLLVHLIVFYLSTQRLVDD